MEGTNLAWRKSSFSSNGGTDCVEAASHNGTILVRDTKDHAHGQVHTFTTEQWRTLVATLKADR
jgi:hypothetical protein